MRYILARDSGGTKCSAMLVREDGVLLGSGQCDVTDAASGRSVVGSGRSPESIRTASLRALGDFRCDELVIVNGIDDSNEYADFAGTLKRSHVSESQAALALAGESCGIVVLAGTGAFVYGETRDGRTCHLDSLGPILGDYGSGYYIGHLALRAAGRSGWAGRHRTSLRQAIYTACGVDMASERVSGDGLTPFSLMHPDRAEVASFAQLVDREAEAGDRIAVDILKSAASAIAETLQDVVDALQIGDQEYPMVGTGGVVHSRIYWQHLSNLVTEIAPGLKPFVSNLPAVVGVALAALQEFGSCDHQVTSENLFRSIEEHNRQSHRN